MTEKPNLNELQELRDRIADLEAARHKPVKVEVEGFEGLRQLSHAIETQQLDRFALQNATPDRVFWGWFWAVIIAVIGVVAYSLIRY
ncbi:MAG: hypothetical protein ACOYLK_03065 [Sphingomonas sp.]